VKSLLLSLSIILGIGIYTPQDEMHITKNIGNETIKYYVEDPGSH